MRSFLAHRERGPPASLFAHFNIFQVCFSNSDGAELALKGVGKFDGVECYNLCAVGTMHCSSLHPPPNSVSVMHQERISIILCQLKKDNNSSNGIYQKIILLFWVRIKR